MKILIQKIHYNEIKGHGALKALLSFASIFYAAIIKLKNLFYEKNILKEKNENAYIICVGNLTTGGVGKTPIVCEIGNYLSQSKKNKIVILSRGYGGKLNNKEPNLIKDFDGIINFDSEQSGDEPFLIAQNTKNCAIITCANRKKGVEYAINYLDANIIIMDDGFSNRKIKKDLTLLVIDSKKQYGNGHILPRGPLREPLSEIKRADKIIVVHKNKEKEDMSFLNEIKKPIYHANFITDFYYNLKSKEIINPKKQKIIAFSGIGQPDQFYELLKNDFEIVKTIDYPDHHSYSLKDICALSDMLAKYGADALVTTEKDGVKLSELAKYVKEDIFILKLKINIDFESILRKEN